MDFLTKRRVMQLIISAFLVFLLVQDSEQQFSYSANWGKRSSDNVAASKSECRNAIKLKQLLQRSPLKLNENFYEYLNMRIEELCGFARNLRDTERVALSQANSAASLKENELDN